MKLTSRHTAAVAYVAALLFFSLATVVWFHDVAFHPDSRVACCIGDGTWALRDLLTATAQHENMLTFSHDSYNGAPEGQSRPPAPLIANAGLETLVASTLRGPLGLVGAWNLYALLGLLGTAMGVFWLLRRLGCTSMAALFGGYVIAFSPYALERLYAGHLSLMQNWVFVVVIAAVLSLRDRRSFGSAALVGVTIGLAFYVSAYQGLLACVTALVFLSVELWRLPNRRDRVRSLALMSLMYGVGALTLAPLGYAYRRESGTVQQAVAHSNQDLFTFAAHVSAYLVPSPRNPLAHVTRSLHPQDLTEETLYVGYATLALAISAVVLIFRRDRWLRESPTRWWTAISFAVLVPVAFALSLPPAYHPGGITIPMPSIFLVATTTFWRVYSRVGLLVGFAMAVLASLALSTLARRPGRRWSLLAPFAIAVAVLELLPGNVGAFNTNSRPDWVAWLAAAPRGIVATYPMDLTQGPSVDLTTQQLWYQTLDHDPSFAIAGQSYVAARSRQQAIRYVANNPAQQVTAHVLATEHVRYVVIDDAAYRAESRTPPIVSPKHFTLLAREGDFRIYSVHASRINLATVLRAHQGEVAALEGFSAPTVVRNGKNLEVNNDSDATRMWLTGHASNGRVSQILEVRDGTGRVLARHRVPTGQSGLRVGPLDVPARSHFSLSLSGGAGIAVSRLALAPLPAYVGTTS